MYMYVYVSVLAIASHPARVLRYRAIDTHLFGVSDKRWELVATAVGLFIYGLRTEHRIYYPLPDSLYSACRFHVPAAVNHLSVFVVGYNCIVA